MADPSDKRPVGLPTHLGRLVHRSLGGGRRTRPVAKTVGAPPGLELHDLERLSVSGQPVPITIIDYSVDRVEVRNVTEVEDFVNRHRPEWAAVRWINIDGLTNLDVVRAMAEKYDLHPLAIEDVLHVPQRPKLDTFPARDEKHGRIFLVARMLYMLDGHLEDEQISIFLGRSTVITFQERAGNDVFAPLRARIQAAGSKLRANNASFLAYSMLDGIVDHCFPLLEHYSDRLEEIEVEVLERPSQGTMQQIHRLKRELLLLRRAVWPMREVISAMSREEHECLSPITRTYLRDVHDHTVQIIEMVETYRELATGLTETHMTAVSNRMNEIMKVLTIMGTIFIPLTFLAGVYGMNFHHMPELDQAWAYPTFWGVCLVMAGSMVAWFRSRKWL